MGKYYCKLLNQCPRSTNLSLRPNGAMLLKILSLNGADYFPITYKDKHTGFKLIQRFHDTQMIKKKNRNIFM